MKNNFKRCLALLMALMMIVGAFSIPVSAAETCNHDYEEIVKAPTCTTVGYTTYICKLCNDSYIEDIQSKLQHNYVKAVVGKVPTCTTPGYIAGAMVCANCGDVQDGIGELTIDPTNHTFDESKTEYKGPKCGEAQVGEKVYTMKWCIECSEANKNNANKGYIVAGEADARVDHEIVTTITKEVKCGSNGEVVKACKYCDYVVDITIIKTPHDYDEANFVIVNANVTWVDENGKSQTAKFAANTNAIKGSVADVAGATVTGTNGTHVKVWYCELCEQVAKAEAVGHTYQVPADKGLDTCYNPGKYSATCKDCKNVTEVTVAESHLTMGQPKTTVASKHTATEVIVGYEVYVCQRCDEDVVVYDDVAYTADAHNPAKYTATNNKTTLKLETATGGYYVAPTCTDVGYGKYVCTYDKCEFYKVAEIKATGHSYGNNVYEENKDNCLKPYTKYQVCTVCGYKDILDTKAPVALGSTGHKKETLEDVKSTCFVAGYKAVGCKKCGEHKDLRETKAILTGHTSKYTYKDNGETGCFVTRVLTTTCSTCKVDKVEEFLYNSHAFVANEEGGSVLVPATCSTSGKWGYACTRTCIGSKAQSSSTGKTKCTGMEVTKTLEFDKNNHLGGKPDSLSNGKTYDYTKGGVDYSLEIKPNYLVNITDAKVEIVPEYSCYELQYTWWYCESCDKEFEKVSEYPVVPEYDVTKVDPKATVYYAGSQNHVWEVKYDVDGDGKIDKDLKEPTCTETGVATKVCKVPGCGAKDEKVTISATGHKKPTSGWTEVEANTCISYGVKKAECANGCGTVLEDKVATSYKAHTYGSEYTITLYPTCSKAGSKYTPCTVEGCTNVKTVTNGDMAKLKHDQYYENGVLKNNFATRKNLGVAATCTTAGVADHYKCGICKTLYKVTNASNETQSTSDVAKTIAALGHTDERKTPSLTAGATVAPTVACTTYSYTPNYCNDCGVERTWTNFTRAAAHVAETEVNKEGKTVDKVYEADAVCYAYAYTYNKCANCGEAFNKVEDKTSTRPHHVNKDGYPLIGDCRVILGDEDCKVCNGTGINCAACEVYYACANKNCTAVIPADHAYVNAEEHVECNAIVSECKFCGKTNAEKITATLPYSHDYIVVVAPTITTEGVEVCKDCGYENENKLPRISAVTFSMNAYNPNGGNIVNGGYVYVDVMMNTVEAISVNNIRVAIKFNTDYLVFAGVAGNESVFGNLSSEPEANDQDGVVYVFDDAGKERFNITLDGEMKFVTIAFYVKPGAYNAKNRLATELQFTDDVKAEFAPTVSYYDVDAKAYSDYAFDITTNDKVDLSVDQLGDVNNDGKINNYDLVAVRDAMTSGAEYDSVLDIDHDGEITIKDYKLIKEYMVAKYEYWQFADIDSYTEYLTTKNAVADDEAKYLAWLVNAKA